MVHHMSYFESYFLESSKILAKVVKLSEEIENLAIRMWDSLSAGNSIYWFGNGGSASDAEHLAAELAGRFRFDRKPLSSFALTANSSLITAIANDYGYEEVFARQVRAYVKEGDVVVGISTSGKSENVYQALNQAKTQGAFSVALVGSNANLLKDCNYVIRADSEITSHIQEAHIAIGQAICGYIENKILEND